MVVNFGELTVGIGLCIARMTSSLAESEKTIGEERPYQPEGIGMTSDSGIQQELAEIKKSMEHIEWFLVALLCLGLVWYFAWILWVLS